MLKGIVLMGQACIINTDTKKIGVLNILMRAQTMPKELKNATKEIESLLQ